MPASGGARPVVRRSCRFGTPELDSARALVEKLAREATKRSRGSGARYGDRQGRSTASGGSDYAGELSRARGNKREGKPGRRQALPCWEASGAAWASRRVTERRRKGGNRARFRQWRLELGFWQAGRRRLRFRV